MSCPPVAYSVVHHLIYTSRLAWTQGWNQNVLAKAKFVGYASERPIGLRFRRLIWRRRGYFHFGKPENDATLGSDVRR